MPIAICTSCGNPAPDSFHKFDKQCKCIDWEAREKKMGWSLKIKGRDY